MRKTPRSSSLAVYLQKAGRADEALSRIGQARVLAPKGWQAPSAPRGTALAGRNREALELIGVTVAEARRGRESRKKTTFNRSAGWSEFKKLLVN